MENILKIYYEELKGEKLTKNEYENFKVNLLKNDYTINEDYTVVNNKPRDFYKKINSKTVRILLDKDDFDIKVIVRMLLGDYIYDVYYNNKMKIEDFVKINTMRPLSVGNRSAFDYYVNMINAWFYEKLIMEWFNKKGYKTKLTGNDCNYTIVSRKYMFGDYDFEVYNPKTKKTMKIEFVNDFNGSTSKYGTLPLREAKLKRNIDLKTWIVVLNHQNDYIYMFESEKVKYEQRKAFGNKKSNVIFVDENTHIIKNI